MMNIKSLLFLTLTLLLIPLQKSWALMELSGGFNYESQVFGSAHDSKYISRNYTASYAWYIFSVTGIELNYSQTDDTVISNDDEAIPDTTAVITQTRSDSTTEVFGGGIRQALLPVKSLIVPQISVGYAKEKKTTRTQYYITYDGGSNTVLDSGKTRTSSNSIYGTFALKLNFSEAFSLNGDVTTVFKAFKFEEAKYNIKYTAGFSWYF